MFVVNKSKVMSMDFLRRSGRSSRLEKIRNDDIEKKIILKILF